MKTPSHPSPARADACTFPRYPAIGLVGPAGVGKDTIADHLVAVAGFRKYSFADALRAEIASAYGIPVELLLERETKETPMTRLALRQCGSDRFICALRPALAAIGMELGMDDPISPRTAMQLWGDYRRHGHPDYWIHEVRTAIRDDRCRFGQPAGIVLADCRYANEVQLVRGYYGGVIWQIERPGFKAKGRHESETSGSQFEPEAILNNSADIPHLHTAAMLAMAACLEGGAA